MCTQAITLTCPSDKWAPKFICPDFFGELFYKLTSIYTYIAYYKTNLCFY